MQVFSKNYASDHDEKIEKEFESMLDDARSTYVIPKQAFENYRACCKIFVSSKVCVLQTCP